MVFFGYATASAQAHSQAPIPPASDEAPTASVIDDETWTFIDSMLATIERHALDAPVRQQMMLRTAQVFYQMGEKKAPAELRTEIAQLTTQDEFRQCIGKHWHQSGVSSWFEDTRHLDTLARMLLRKLQPQADFISAKEHRVRNQIKDNQYVGIGIQIRWESNLAMIDVAFPGGAAQQAGAKTGDLILKVDGQSMEGLNLGQVVEVLRGAKGTKLSVTVRHKDENESRTLNMTRDVVPIASLQGIRQRDDGSWEFVDGSGPFAYMQVSSLVGSTAAELQQAARDVGDAAAKAVVLDLSQLRDADIHQATMFIDTLVGEMELGVMHSNDGTQRLLQSREDRLLVDIPIAVITADKTSGPVLMLLNALQRRPHTTLIGPAVESDMMCFDSFELPDGLGAIDHLPYAHVQVNLEGAADGDLAVHPGVNSLNGDSIVRLRPSIEETGRTQQLDQAKQWLAEQVDER